tara:strand:- start:1261 stop:2142 length:882 start_codon:yes stop_codon:yes gene_type:complete
MSIKQNGGVFGRNPTFNDVTIEGQLTFDGDIDINSDLKVDGDLDVTGSSSVLGSMAIGSASPSVKFHVNGGTGNQIGLFESTDATVKIGFKDSATTNNYSVTIGAVGDEMTFSSGSGGTERIRVNTAGNVTVSTGNLIIGTSGKGIDFSATSGTGTSELLDDYEEGTWTPTITGSTSGSVAGITINRAAYTKIGNQVTVYFYISAVNLDTASLVGNAEIGGLPFNSANSFMQLSAVNYTNFFSFDESDISVGSYVHSGTKVKLLKGSSTSGIPVGELSGTTQIMMFGMTYESS